MPPQQGYRLPDLVDNILRFRAHGLVFCPVAEVTLRSARYIGTAPPCVKRNGPAPRPAQRSALDPSVEAAAGAHADHPVAVGGTSARLEGLDDGARIARRGTHAGLAIDGDQVHAVGNL